MNEKLHIPSKFDFYTLKQAADELKIRLKELDIDETYLLNLAASGKICLSIAMSNQYKLKCHVIQFGDDHYCCIDRAVAHYMVDKDDFSKFLNVNDSTIRELFFSGQASQTVFNEMFIYDPSSEIRKKLDLYIEDIQQGQTTGNIGIEPILFEKSFSFLNEKSQAKVLKETPKVIKDLSIEIEEFIQYKFDSSFWNFGLINRNNFGDRVPVVGSFVEPVEFCDIEILQNDLFIVKPEFERILNSDFRKPESIILVNGTTDKEARFPSALLDACKSLKLPPKSLTTGNRVTNKLFKDWFKSRSEYKDLTDCHETFRKLLRENIRLIN